MAAKKATAPVQKDLPSSQVEDRIDDIAIGYFEALGYKGRLPDSLVATYQKFRGLKDGLLPGPLSPEAYVTVLFLAGIVDREF